MKLPLPQRGQPFDVSLISNIITSINDLWDNIVVNASNYASIWTFAEGKKSIRSSEVKFVTGRTENINGKMTDGDVKPFSYTFDSPFLLPPVVTATAQALDNSEPSKSAYAVITSVSVGKIEGIVRFESKGQASIAVNIIAIGVSV
jgi:hypothetical protein